MFLQTQSVTYRVKKRGVGKPLVCLHGFGEDMSTWDDLEVEGHQLILIDLIGHGQSSKPYAKRHYRTKTIVRHLKALLSRLGLKQYALLGYSMGGRIALAYALRYPDDVEHLILESASYGERNRKDRRERRQADANLAQNILRNGADWFEKHFSEMDIFKSQERLPPEAREKISARRRHNLPHALSNMLLASGQGVSPCLYHRLSELLMPVSCLSGEYDTKYTKIGSEFQKRNPKIAHRIIENAGHNTHIENRDRFQKVLWLCLLGQ
ncbi:MAG: 2-succinyl-6-hydroxy-2,4-cyclohexadiene-1-carboxylate synthase [Burkholderiales bacterium]|jgi:2-succinyl-6-hydroxy-2,4-cyclohexadiene-1-carboxylate synthase|nr:2-succinyl-6-hydroxy-2,4-cyclohexadiene-1-carboxylate synthase [Burkholderiales bacterium]